MSQSNRYWTLERLTRLVKVLQNLGACDQGQWYLGPDVTSWSVHRALLGCGFTHGRPQTLDGLNVLLHLEVLAPGRPGQKAESYRRLFYPNVIARLTEAELDDFYARRNHWAPRKTYRQSSEDLSAGLAPGVLPDVEFWTVPRLRWLVEVMRSFAQRDAPGWYFDTSGSRLREIVHCHIKQYGFCATHVALPLDMLMFLGVLTPGNHGGRGSRRREFFPDVDISEEALQQYRQARR